jgi:hypothetical protein
LLRLEEMLDVFYVAVGLGFFVLSFALVRLCDRL